jgi:GTPase SAR1 family protein
LPFCNAAYHRVADLHERIVQIKRQLGIDNPCVVLVGNKCDRQDREVSFEAGQTLAQRLGIPHFYEVRLLRRRLFRRRLTFALDPRSQTSARSNLNVQEAFHTLTRAVLASKNLSPVAAPSANGGAPQRRRKKRSGCTIL